MIPSSDPRLTAYALGEMDEAERQAFEAELMKSEEAQRQVAELSSAADLLRGELENAAPEELPATQREKIKAAAGGDDEQAPAANDGEGSLPKVVAKEAAVLRPSFGRRAAQVLAPLAVAAGILGLLYTQAFNGSKEAANVAYNEDAPAAKARGSAALASMPQATAVATAAAHADSFASSSPKRMAAKDKKSDNDDMPAPNTGIPSDDPLPENAFLDASKDPKSTFSVDVDTASYAIVRRLVESGQKPQPGNVRIEEMINYFKYSYPEPNDAAFGVHTDATSAPWAPSHRLVRIGLKGKTVQMAKRPASNLVFLIDVSGSMDGADRIELLKKSFEMLVEQLDERDTVSIVVYAGAAGTVLEPTKGNEKRKILDALQKLKSGGSTNGGQGIQLAYATAKKGFIEGGTNRVILASDGDFNVGISNRVELTKLIEEQAKSGVFLSVLGFGTGNTRDTTMETLADKGNGNYSYIDSLTEGRKVLVEQAAGTLITIAKDVKIQITWDPKTVQSFRLIGYENRVLKHEDFENDKKDAGDIGAGHTVTALYEIVPVGSVSGSTHLADVALRYKQPDGVTSRLVETTVVDTGSDFASASTDFRFAASVAGFGMLLRNSAHKGDLAYPKLLEMAKASLGDDSDGYRGQFVGIVEKASRLSDR